jgi:hypothetical protein
MNKVKPFDMAKAAVWEAFQRVKATKGRLGWLAVDPGL